jgi:hypothetical protein
MANGAYEVRILQIKGHWEVYINDVFFCSADSYTEAVNEIRDVYGH